MTGDEAWFIVRLAYAVGEEGIWHWVAAPGGEQERTDTQVLDEAVRIAWDRMTPAQQEDLGPRPGGQ